MQIGWLLVALLLLDTVRASAETPAPVTMMTNTWPPYVDAQLPEGGLALELVTHIFQQAGLPVDNSIERWPRAMEGVRVGLYDVLGAAWRDEERERDFIYSDPYLLNDIILVTTKAANRRPRSLEQLAGSRIGVLEDYSYGVDLKGIDGVSLVVENHMIQSLMNLFNGKVDYVIGDNRVIALMLSEYLEDRRGELTPLDITLPNRGLYVAASRSKVGTEDLIARFNTALAKARSDGSYQRIVDAWNQRYAM